MRTRWSTATHRLPDRWRKRGKWLGVVAGVAALLFMPALLRGAAEVLPVPPGGVMLRIVITILIWSLLAIGQNLITGFCGQMSVGHAAFYGVGAYTSALLVMRLEVPYIVAFFAAGAASALVGLAIGLPAIRIRGLYLFIVTIGLGEIAQQVFLNWDAVTNGPLGLPGIPLPTILGYEIATNTQFYYFALVVVALVVAATYRIVNSDIGRSFQAIREDETAAIAMGINATYYKTLAFVLGAFYAGLAGSIVAHFLSVIGPTQFSIDESVLVFLMVILGGLGSIAGSIVGTAVVICINESFRILPEYRLFIGGFLFVGLMLWRTQGIMGTVNLAAPKVAPEGQEEAEAARAVRGTQMEGGADAAPTSGSRDGRDPE